MRCSKVIHSQQVRLVYYVYELIDPRSDAVFYVGKGTGKRHAEHVKDAKKGFTGCKCDLIRDILADGHEIVCSIVKRFESEDAAFSYEKKRIEKHGIENLTNIAPGGREITSAEYYRRKDARKYADSMCRMARKLDKHREIGFWFCGKFYDVDRSMAVEMLHKGIQHVFDVLGKSEALAVFAKRNVFIGNNP